jgi:hypothetical protein
MIHIKLSPPHPPKRPDDPWGRDWVGWGPDQTPQQIYDRNRGRWYLGPRAAHEQYTVFSSTVTGTIVAVVANEGTEDVDGQKKAIVGRVLGPGDPVHDMLIGQPMPDRHRNPVTYVDDPVDHWRTCACGCGGQVTGARVFLPGHDQRAVHERIARQWGDTLGFITWFDREYGTDR